MTNVRQLLEAKGQPQIVSVAPEQSTYEALQLMAEKDIGAVTVMEGDKLVGMLTEREYARRIVLEGKKSRHTPVAETMRSNLVTITPERTIYECMQLMMEQRIRYLPVVDHDALVGVVSVGDIVKSVIREQQTNIEHLERYVTGGEFGVS